MRSAKFGAVVVIAVCGTVTPLALAQQRTRPPTVQTFTEARPVYPDYITYQGVRYPVQVSTTDT